MPGFLSSETLREQIRRTPFHPVTLLLPSGQTVTIDNPELAMFTEPGRTLLVAQGEHVIFINVATVEAVETVAD